MSNDQVRQAVHSKAYQLSVTTQGPTYPPSEVMDEDGNFIVIGRINRQAINGEGVHSSWGQAIVSPDSDLPPFGKQYPYRIVQELPEELDALDLGKVLYTLPLPLPCNNYPMLFAPQQCPHANSLEKPSYPFHEVPIPDSRPEDGRKLQKPITLGQWVQAKGELQVSLSSDSRSALFTFKFSGMIPNSLYTVMSLREKDLDPVHLSRPGPLGVPNVFITDAIGSASYEAQMPNPFPTDATGNRIINVVVLWMSYQCSYGGAIGYFGLGGDIHAQLKLTTPSFFEFETF